VIEHRHETAEPVVALTFDDGPSEWTEQILDALVAHGGAATFFALGSCAERRPHTLRRIYECGSEVGNHTYSHRRLTTLSDDEILDELNRTTAVLEEITERRMRYWRAPFFGFDERVCSVAEQTGLEEVRCSLRTDDYGWPTELTAETVLAEARPGSIVDLHDGRPDEDEVETVPTREATVAAVELILRAFDSRGWRCVTVSDLVGAGSAPPVAA
jgi:peptidoglycan/xylan/chitin deacetylase (PgdA/CDA1 family)